VRGCTQPSLRPMKPVLYVGNRNYSSWSMRPWLVLTAAGIDFETRVIPLGGEGYRERRMAAVLAVSGSGTVPALHVGDVMMPDSLAIAEWAAEKSPRLWPEDEPSRMLARSATCEMHSGFSSIRSKLPCNIRRRAPPRELDLATKREVERVEALWTSLRERNEGPYLFGPRPTIADFFFTPMATRFRTYAVKLGTTAQRYADTLLSEPTFRAWEAEAIAEEWTMPEWDRL
jgi:glutathione S-transferase